MSASRATAIALADLIHRFQALRAEGVDAEDFHDRFNGLSDELAALAMHYASNKE